MCLSFCPWEGIWCHSLSGPIFHPEGCMVPGRYGPREGYSIPYPLTSSGGHRSGQYASYWYAFFLTLLQAGLLTDVKFRSPAELSVLKKTLLITMKSNISTHHVWMAWNNCKKIIYFSGGCDLSGRVLFGWFADLGYIKKHYLMSILIGTLSIITCVCINVQSFASYVVLAVAIGIFGK